MKARIPVPSMMVHLRGVPNAAPERTFQGVLDRAGVVSGLVEVTADFPRVDCPVLPIGTEAAVGFTGPYLGSAIWAAGQVVYRREEQFRHRYKFRFPDGAQSALRRVIDCRRAPRVRLDPRKGLLVGVKTNEKDLPVQAVMNDISVTGISILVPLEAEAKLFSVWAVQVAFRLPGAEAVLKMAGSVCYRRLAGEYIAYGIDFDPLNTTDFEAKQARVLAFVERVLATRAARKTA